MREHFEQFITSYNNDQPHVLHIIKVVDLESPVGLHGTIILQYRPYEIYLFG